MTAVLLFIACGKRSDKPYGISDDDGAAIDAVVADTMRRDTIMEDGDDSDETSKNNRSRLHSAPSSSKANPSDGPENNGMFGFDPNYEDPDNKHDVDHFMNETDDEWAD